MTIILGEDGYSFSAFHLTLLLSENILLMEMILNSIFVGNFLTNFRLCAKLLTASSESPPLTSFSFVPLCKAFICNYLRRVSLEIRFNRKKNFQNVSFPGVQREIHFKKPFNCYFLFYVLHLEVQCNN